MKNIFSYILDPFSSRDNTPSPSSPISDNNHQTIITTEMMPIDLMASPVAPQSVQASFNGDKFFGGFGPTNLFSMDYWTLRQRSAQLFTENLYARGLIRRFVTNEINTGLAPEMAPDKNILGNLAPPDLGAWTEDVENRFAIFGENPKACDYKQVDTFGEIQKTIRREALVDGDILVVLRISQQYQTPQIQLINGGKVQTPFNQDMTARIQKGHRIRYGVEFNKGGRVVAYWVNQDKGGSKRLPAWGEKSGRRLAWLVYGTDKRMDDVRGQPLLSLILQSLKEIDRYRDATLRKAVINSILAMFIKKTNNKVGSLPMQGGAVRNTTTTVTDGNGSTRNYDIASQIPGVVMQDLQEGEEPIGFHSQGTDTVFGIFEEAIINTVAWANETPPEILRLSFSSNYSASQAAVNEYRMYLDMVRRRFGVSVCHPIFIEWLVMAVLSGKISAPNLLNAWRNPAQYDIFGAYLSTNWYGSIKPSTNMLKQAKASKMLVATGWSTNAREARLITGTKFSKNIIRLIEENKLLVEAARPFAEFKKEYGEKVAAEALGSTSTAAKVEDSIIEAVETALENKEDG